MLCLHSALRNGSSSTAGLVSWNQRNSHLASSDAGNFGGDLQKKADYTWQTMKCKSGRTSSLQIFLSSKSQSELIFTEFFYGVGRTSVM